MGKEGRARRGKPRYISVKEGPLCYEHGMEEKEEDDTTGKGSSFSLQRVQCPVLVSEAGFNGNVFLRPPDSF